MKKGKIATALLTVLFLLYGLVGCNSPGSAKAAVVPTSKDYKSIFELKLYTDKTLYQPNEKISVWATLLYKGSNDQIEIWHSDPFISFSITDGGKFNTDEIFDGVLAHTMLDQGKLYHFDYQKSGGYTAEDPNAPFWQKFYADPDLRLPPGHYTVKVRGAFYLDKQYASLVNDLQDEIEITVG